ncbi:hypothetical protein AS188_00705 [Kocuria flava]|uniref:DUF4397 domain-containing protein n=1 Tax=Kocuria flava TaxID=446860 RepID=A0A0U2YSK1_9MICC|nr:DUF4397 domain-containing protein [Kocuria flava]ALU38513.1 hypothetical protein AS188_00705 [Kocuria flava]GEO93268.1 hypothetical protein KFL01_25740 [Kocuria flava]
MRKTLSAAAVLGLGAGALSMSPAAAAEHAELSVLHGVPDTVVDVWVNGELTLDDFEPGTLAGPLELPAGSYDLAITAPDAPDASAPIIGPVTAELEPGTNYTAAAHLDAEGSPTAALFTNDMSEIEAGKSHLTVRHVAAAPAVDVLAGGRPIIQGLENPDEQTLPVDAGTVSAAVAAAGTTDPVIGPADLTLAEGTHNIVYAWGSLEAGNLQLAVQTLEGMEQAPGAVPGGQSGLAAQESGTMLSTGLAAAGGLALIGAALAAQRAVSSRRRFAQDRLR